MNLAENIEPQEIIIDPEFKALIPPLSDEERGQLEENISRDGCREPLAVWTGTNILLDGHNRHEICERLEIPYLITLVNLPDREAALDWIDSNQLGRRNLSPDLMSLLRGRIYNRRKRAKGAPEGNQNRAIQMGQNDPFETRSTAETLGAQFGVSAPTIKRDGKFADSIESIKPHVPDIEQRVMSGEFPKKEIIEAAKEPEKAEEKLRHVHVAQNSGNNEWYTPEKFIEMAREVMGSIDTDPATSEIANRTVQAERFFTADDDGRHQEWAGNVWMNPPYSQPLISDFSEAVASKYEQGEIQQACILVNNATETGWFQRMVSAASAVCFPKTRIKFVDLDGNPSGAPLQGQAVIYMGDNPEAFVALFSREGFALAKR